MATSQNPSGPQPAANPAPRGPKLLSADEHWGGTFFSRLKEFLTERPVRLPAGRGRLPFTPESPRTDFLDNLKTALSAEPRLPKGAESSPLLIRWGSGWDGFWQNLRDLISPPKLPPLKVTSAPGPPPKDIWSKDENASRAQWLSVLVHALIVLMLGVPLWHEITTMTTEAKTPELTSVDISDLSDYVTKLPKGNSKAGGGGGGGDRNPVPASKGRLPKASLNPQLAPPTVVIMNPNPKLPVQPTVFMPPEIKVPQPNLPNYGDPLAAMVTNSNGPGSGGGIGTGTGGGVGSGGGPGVGPGEGGGIGGGHYRVGSDGIGEPVCIYCPHPPFTEEARKARYQGTVLLEITILPDGTPTDVRVVRGLGMGLDEKAIETVRQWRFKPMIGPGNKPVAVDVSLEINFRLL
jgi:periplasmic protein TonB